MDNEKEPVNIADLGYVTDRNFNWRNAKKKTLDGLARLRVQRPLDLEFPELPDDSAPILRDTKPPESPV